MEWILAMSVLIFRSETLLVSFCRGSLYSSGRSRDWRRPMVLDLSESSRDLYFDSKLFLTCPRLSSFRVYLVEGLSNLRRLSSVSITLLVLADRKSTRLNSSH